MSYEYYNPSIVDLMDRRQPQDEDPRGCLWQLLLLTLLVAILMAVYMV